MSGDQHRGNPARRHGEQEVELQEEREHQARCAEGSDVRVLHDREYALAAQSSSESVGGIREAILVQGPRDDHRGGHAERDCNARGKHGAYQQVDRRPGGSDEGADHGQVTDGSFESLLRMAGATRDSQAREVLNRCKQAEPLPAESPAQRFECRLHVRRARGLQTSRPRFRTRAGRRSGDVPSRERRPVG